jgi:hypothetical protein
MADERSARPARAKSSGSPAFGRYTLHIDPFRDLYGISLIAQEGRPGFCGLAPGLEWRFDRAAAP